ncbi:MAG: hypothetical protein KKD99_03785 [Proteobacteria bacterium]|nr:hypothetical protein [Pseudomonadota bacterium]MBU4354490.1 hypothetical protein [Pseudomonadota bacterium]MBU4447686.1 hypothetical protein [Pseudomonadota bacterium]MCG2773061.1 hypothetical protein [Desulfobacterales bacterium]
MDLGQVTRWRDLASKIAAAFCVIALLVLVDGLLVHFRERANFVKVLPGASVEINGELTDEAHRVEELTFTSDSDQLKVIFEAIHKGYFLGGDMWRGRLIVGPDIAPGEYNLSVLPMRSDSPRKAPAFRIKVFPDALSLQKSSTSLVRRWFGVSAFVVAAGCLPEILLAFGAVFLLSGKRDALLAASGQAEIYRVTKGDGGCEIHFGLGTAHGISPGATVAIYDAGGQPVGTGTVEVCNRKVSVAQATSDQVIKVGDLVSRV